LSKLRSKMVQNLAPILFVKTKPIAKEIED